MQNNTVIWVFALITVAGCHLEEHEHTIIGAATETQCPTPSDLTYDNFGALFVSSQCLGCHSDELVGEARNGAPTDHNFDTAALIRAQADHIDRVAGAGPASTNSFMPLTTDPPSTAERTALSEWLACGAP